MKWIVTNALSRDVEREHLNKILQEISGRVGDSNSTVENITTTINNTVLKSFTLKLAGDVTGSVKVNDSGVFVLNTTLAEQYVMDAPLDGKAYVRKDGAWVIATTDDVEEGDDNLYFTPDRAAEAIVDAIDQGVSGGIYVEYDSGTIDISVQRKCYVSPVETPDGVLTVFTVPEVYVEGSLVVTLNGLVEPITELDEFTFEFVEPPEATDTIYLDYF